MTIEQAKTAILGFTSQDIEDIFNRYADINDDGRVFLYNCGENPEHNDAKGERLSDAVLIDLASILDK